MWSRLDRLSKALSVLADFIQIVSFDWRSLLPTFVTGLALAAIGYMSGANAFLIAVGVPFACAAMVFIAVLMRAWTLIGAARIRQGVPPIMAIDLYTDTALRDKRNEAARKQHELWNQLEVVARQIKQAARRNRRRLIGVQPDEPSAEKRDLGEKRMNLAQLKNLADLEYNAAHNDVLVDFYGKLFNGQLIAHGFLLPIKAGTAPADIPSVEWHFLRFDDKWHVASGQGVSYNVVAIRKH